VSAFMAILILLVLPVILVKMMLQPFTLSFPLAIAHLQRVVILNNLPFQKSGLQEGGIQILEEIQHELLY